MRVKMYTLPRLEQSLAAAAPHGIEVKRAIAPERNAVIDWARIHFPSSVSEIETAFAQVPATCFIALHEGRVAGFACYDVTARNFFGPEGVDVSMRGKGIGRALVTAAEDALLELGCPKVQLMVRPGNQDVLGFYDSLGYERFDTTTTGKRLIAD